MSQAAEERMTLCQKVCNTMGINVSHISFTIDAISFFISKYLFVIYCPKPLWSNVPLQPPRVLWRLSFPVRKHPFCLGSPAVKLHHPVTLLQMSFISTHNRKQRPFYPKAGNLPFWAFLPQIQRDPRHYLGSKHNNQTQVLTKHLIIRGNTRCWANVMGDLFSLCICLSFQIFPSLDIFTCFLVRKIFLWNILWRSVQVNNSSIFSQLFVFSLFSFSFCPCSAVWGQYISLSHTHTHTLLKQSLIWDWMHISLCLSHTCCSCSYVTRILLSKHTRTHKGERYLTHTHTCFLAVNVHLSLPHTCVNAHLTHRHTVNAHLSPHTWMHTFPPT